MSSSHTTEKIAAAATKKIDNLLELSPERREIVRYGLVVLITNVIGITGALLVALIINSFFATLAILLALLLLRPNAGGAHCRTPFNCNFLGVLVLPFLGLAAGCLANLHLNYKILFYAASFIFACSTIYRFAPVFTQDKPRAAARKSLLKKRAAIMSALIASAAAIMTLPVNIDQTWPAGLAVGLFWQGLMLLPCCTKLIGLYDTALSRITDYFYKEVKA